RELPELAARESRETPRAAARLLHGVLLGEGAELLVVLGPEQKGGTRAVAGRPRVGAGLDRRVEDPGEAAGEPGPRDLGDPLHAEDHGGGDRDRALLGSAVGVGRALAHSDRGATLHELDREAR